MEEKSYDSTPLKRPPKRQRKHSNELSPEPNPVLLDRPTGILSEEQLPSRLLPQLIYVNEPIIVEREGGGQGRIPQHKFSKYFLHALHLTTSAHGFDLQPCWLSLPQNFQPPDVLNDEYVCLLLLHFVNFH